MTDYQKYPLLTARHQDTVADHWLRWRDSLTEQEKRNVCDFSLSQCNCSRLHYR